MLNWLTSIFGGKKDTLALIPQRSSLYSQTVDATLRPVLYAIKGKHDAFATNFFPMDDSAEKRAAPARCLKAWQNPKSKLWQVQQWTYLPPAYTGKESGAFKIDNAEHMNLCFFDALRLCAEFQLGQEKDGKRALPAPDRDWGKIVNWREAAEAAKQVSDLDGMVHPCANGEILIRGFSFFDEKAIKLASKSARVEIPAGSGLIAPAPQHAAIDPALLAAVGANDGTLLDTAADKRKAILAYDNVIKAGDELITRYSWAHDDIPQLCEKFNEAAAHLPLQKDRDHCYELAKNVLTDFNLRLAFQVRKYHPAEAQNGFPYIEKAAALQGLGSEALEKIKASYLVEAPICITPKNHEKTWGINHLERNRDKGRSGLSLYLKNKRNAITL